MISRQALTCAVVHLILLRIPEICVVVERSTTTSHRLIAIGKRGVERDGFSVDRPFWRRERPEWHRSTRMAKLSSAVPNWVLVANRERGGHFEIPRYRPAWNRVDGRVVTHGDVRRAPGSVDTRDCVRGRARGRRRSHRSLGLKLAKCKSSNQHWGRSQPSSCSVCCHIGDQRQSRSSPRVPTTPRYALSKDAIGCDRRRRHSVSVQLPSYL